MSRHKRYYATLGVKACLLCRRGEGVALELGGLGPIHPMAPEKIYPQAPTDGPGALLAGSISMPEIVGNQQ